MKKYVRILRSRATGGQGKCDNHRHNKHGFGLDPEGFDFRTGGVI